MSKIIEQHDVSKIQNITRFNKFDNVGDKIEFYDIRHFSAEEGCWLFAHRWFKTIEDANFYRMRCKFATRDVDIVKVTWEIAEHVEAYDRSLKHENKIEH